MYKYDPDIAPDSEEWNAFDEAERVRLVEEYHRRKRIKLPNAEVHAILHVVVENQITLVDEINSSKALDRLMAEGLDRHDALHAIASVVLRQMQSMMQGVPTPCNLDELNADLDALTIEKWQALGD